jgi:hypothetical protein
MAVALAADLAGLVLASLMPGILCHILLGGRRRSATGRRFRLQGRVFSFVHSECFGSRSTNAVPERKLIFSLQTICMQHADFIALLDRNTEETLSQARSYTDEALNVAPAGCWTPLQVFEHICLTEALVIGLLQRPSEEVHDTGEVHGSSKLRHLIVNKRATKLQAPERLHPKGALANEAAFETTFTAQRNALKEALADGRIITDNRMYPHPSLGKMTVSDWLFFLVHHTERHVEQLKELATQSVG